MYDYLRGRVVSKQLNSYRGTHVVLDVNNIGYLILTGKRTNLKLNEVSDDNDVKVFVSLIHREDSMTFIGFLSKEERDIFNILQSVSGIGVKLALLILDEFEISELVDIMIKEDFKELSRAKGVGVKVAQKIILELKEKLINWANISPMDRVEVDSKTINQDSINDVQSVLISLGYSQDEIKTAIKTVSKYNSDCTKTEDILKYTLEFLAKNS